MRRIVWIGRFRGHGGFAASTREYFMSIIPYFKDIKLAPLSALDEDDPFKKYAVSLPLEETELKVINHLPVTDPEAEAFFSVWEYNKIPDMWVEIFNEAKLIMTQSNFCKNVYSKQIDDPGKIYVIPYIIPEQFKPEGKKLRFGNDDTFIFGSVFEWVPRKNIESTIFAFVEEFDKKEPVKLVLRSKYPHKYNNKKILGIIEEDPRVELITKPIEKLEEFYRGLDCYISCTNGEGYGQTLTEAMVCGAPTMGSRHSGNLDFMNDSNSYLVEVNDWSPVPGKVDVMWKTANMESLKTTMRKVFEERGSAAQKKKIENAINLKKELTREKWGPFIADLLKKII